MYTSLNKCPMLGVVKTSECSVVCGLNTCPMLGIVMTSECSVGLWSEHMSNARSCNDK